MKVITKQMFEKQAEKILMDHTVSELKETIMDAMYRCHAEGYGECMADVRNGELEIAGLYSKKKVTKV